MLAGMNSSPAPAPVRTSPHATEELQAWTSGTLGTIRLNRPQALNAMTLDMVQSMDRVLQDWETDDAVQSVVLYGAGERGLVRRRGHPGHRLGHGRRGNGVLDR